MKEEPVRETEAKTKKKLASLPELVVTKKPPPASPKKAKEMKRASSPQKGGGNSAVLKNGITSNSTTYKQMTHKKSSNTGSSQRSKSASSGGRFFNKQHQNNSSGKHQHYNNHNQPIHNTRSSSGSSKNNDVELIVRKKLITTTTTTTMTPIHAGEINNSASQSQFNNENNKCQDESSTSFQETSLQSHVTVQKANPSSTSDAMASLVSEFAHSSSNLIISPNHAQGETGSADKDDIDDALMSPASSLQQQQQSIIVNNRLTSTVKKEQLEYEFRLRPRTVVSRSLNNSLNANCIKRKKNSKKFSKFHRAKLRGNEGEDNLETNEEEADEEEDEDENESDDGGYYTDPHRGGRRRRNRLNDPNTPLFHCPRLFSFQSNCCAARHRDKSEPESDESPSNSLPHQQSSNSSNPIRFLLNKLACCIRPKADFTDQSSGDVPGALLIVKPKKTASNSLEEIIERPPVTCIRVLRPSNDLTPVRFDSKYNIIQAVTSGSFSEPSEGNTPSLPSPPSNDANKNAVDVISSIMEDALTQQNSGAHDFSIGAYTKV